MNFFLPLLLLWTFSKYSNGIELVYDPPNPILLSDFWNCSIRGVYNSLDKEAHFFSTTVIAARTFNTHIMKLREWISHPPIYHNLSQIDEALNEILHFTLNIPITSPIPSFVDSLYIFRIIRARSEYRDCQRMSSLQQSV